MSTTDETKKSPAKPESKQEAPAQKSEAVKRIIYVGPTLLEGLGQFDVFKGEVPKKYAKRFENNPEFAQLFVESGEFVTAKDEVEQPGTVLHTAYRKIKEEGVI